MTHQEQTYLEQPYPLFGRKHFVAEFLIAPVGLDIPWFEHVDVEAVAQRSSQWALSHLGRKTVAIPMYDMTGRVLAGVLG